MGAWDIGPFENDDALDFLCEIEESNGFGLIEDKFDEVIDSKAEDASVASEAVAGAALVAAARSGDRSGLPEEASVWVAAGQKTPSAALVQKAVRSLELILDEEQSELRQLMEENEDMYPNWRASVQQLLGNLR